MLTVKTSTWWLIRKVVHMICWLNLAFGNRFSTPILNEMKATLSDFPVGFSRSLFVNDMSWLRAMVLLFCSLGSVQNGSGLSDKSRLCHVCYQTQVLTGTFCLLLTAVWWEAWFSRNSCVTVILSIVRSLVFLWLDHRVANNLRFRVRLCDLDIYIINS